MSSALGGLADGLPELLGNPLTAWRKWDVRDGDLRSLNGHRWPYFEPFSAVCQAAIVNGEKPGHVVGEPAPARRCSCGVYAAKSVGELAESGYSIVAPDPDTAWGTVKLWGRVVVHERGWRAQYAYPEHLYVAAEVGHLAELLRRNYGVPVTVIEAPPRPAPAPTPTVVGGGGAMHGPGVLPDIRQLAAATGHALGSHELPILMLTLRDARGFCHVYNGAADPETVGRWFAAFVPQMWAEGANGVQWQWALQVQAGRK